MLLCFARLRYSLPVTSFRSNMSGYHADDTQGENVIFCAVVQSEDGVRDLHIKADTQKGDKPLEAGDEELLICADQGDAYEQDGKFSDTVYNYS